MIGYRGFTALALACAASAIGCSSSSGSSGTPTKFACSSQNPMSNQACTSCGESKCSSEATTAFGSGFASGDLGGGACGSYFTCEAACACNDLKCVENCGPPSGACNNALGAVEGCTAQNCS